MRQQMHSLVELAGIFGSELIEISSDQCERTVFVVPQLAKVRNGHMTS